jgi:protein-disulfide isomerase
VQLLSLVVGLLFSMLFCLSTVPAQQSSASPLEREQIIQRLKEEVLKELRDGGLLQQEIDRGIQRFFHKQRESEAAAREEQERLATEKIKNVRRVSVSRDHIFGNTTAPVSLIVYADFECPYCKLFHQTSKNIVKEYNGAVNLVYRHFPLNLHNPGAQKQAEGSECANEQGGHSAFWNFTDAIYARTKSNGNGFPLTNLAPLAKELGLDAEVFQRCLDTSKYEARVREDFLEGSGIGITGTPASILLHNQTGEAVLRPGALPLEAFKPDIDRMLR